jgi:formate dehydrogenase maturation protein FdhE
MTDELKEIQEEKLSNEPQQEQFTEEQIQQARDIVESRREEAMSELKKEFIKDYADMELLEIEHVIEYLRKWTEKYLDSIVNTTISFPRMIKTNQETIIELEKALENMKESDE